MTKTLKQQAQDKIKAKKKATVMFWDNKGTSDIHNARQSINQKTERSEEDVKSRFNEIITPLTVITVLNFLLLLTLVVR